MLLSGSGQADDQRGQDDRRHQHLDQPDKHLGHGLQLHRLRWPQVAAQRPQEEPEQDVECQPWFFHDCDCGPRSADASGVAGRVSAK